VVNDQHGLTLTGGVDAVDAHERAVDHLLRFQAEVVDEVRASLAADPSFPMGTVLSVYLSLMSTDAGDVARARHALEGLARTVDLAGLQPREQAHLRAAETWVAGDMAGAGRLLDEIAVEHPTDIVALAAGHQIDFFSGDAVNLRDRVGRAMASWDPADPRFGFVLGMYAFGLEECNLYGPSAEAGLRALDANPDDVWAVHAVVHSHEMRGEVPEGLQFMRTRERDWATGNFLNVHNSWHYALFLLEADDVVGALDLYDRAVRNADSSDVALELLDATALLWRLHLEDVPVGDRWQPLADGWTQVLEPAFYPFNDMHAAMAFVGAGRLDQARDLVASMTEVIDQDDPSSTGRTMTASVGLPVCRAVVRFGQDDHQAVVDELWPIRRRVHTFGGSHAQRDAVERTLLESALRVGRHDLASALLNERLALRDRSTYGWAKQAQLRAAIGDGPGSEAAAGRRAGLAAAARAAI
jgi:hypothetical protein